MSNGASHHEALVTWQRAEGEAFTDNRYSRRHAWRFDGGAEVAASSSPHAVRLPFSDPSAVDPEEAFVASLASCHMLWFLSIAAQRGFCVDSYQDAATGTMQKNAAGKVAITAVTLKPEVRFSGKRVPTSQELAEMHHEAHEQCFIANSVTSEIVCEPVMPEGPAD